MCLRKLSLAFASIGLSCMTADGVLVTLCKDHFCTQDCITADLNENNYMPEGTPRDEYRSLRVENPEQDTNVFVSKHHFCSYYSGREKRYQKQPQAAALLRVAAGDNKCHDVANFGQNQGTTVIKSACIANPNRLRPGDLTPPIDMEPMSSANQLLPSSPMGFNRIFWPFSLAERHNSLPEFTQNVTTSIMSLFNDSFLSNVLIPDDTTNLTRELSKVANIQLWSSSTNLSGLIKNHSVMINAEMNNLSPTIIYLSNNSFPLNILRASDTLLSPVFKTCFTSDQMKTVTISDSSRSFKTSSPTGHS